MPDIDRYVATMKPCTAGSTVSRHAAALEPQISESPMIVDFTLYFYAYIAAKSMIIEARALELDEFFVIIVLHHDPLLESPANRRCEALRWPWRATISA